MEDDIERKFRPMIMQSMKTTTPGHGFFPQPRHTGEVVPYQLQNRSTSRPNLEGPEPPFKTIAQVTEALARAGLESSNMILGIDFTKSDQQTREQSFMRQSLHLIGHSSNPYEQAISIIEKTLAACDEDNLIPCFGFGDSSTHDKVTSADPEHGRLSTQEQKTVDAIVEFANFMEFMSNNMSPLRKEAAFALAALAFMEIPSHYEAAIELGLLRSPKANAPRRVSFPTPPYGSASLGTSSSTYDNQSGWLERFRPWILFFRGINERTWYREFLIKVVDFGCLHKAVDSVSALPRRLYRSCKEYVNANRESGLPIFSRPDLRDTLPRFMPYLRDSVLNIPPTYNWGLLLLSVGYLTSHTKNTTAPYQYFQLLEKTTKAPPQPLMLTLGEACDTFSREMTDMTKFILGYFLCLLLLYPLHPGVQIVCLLIWVLIPFTYFPDLVRNSSRSGVTIGTFKLAPLSFTSLGAVGISTICLAATMLILYIRFRLSNRNPRVVEDVDGNLNGLAEVLEG